MEENTAPGTQLSWSYQCNFGKANHLELALERTADPRTVGYLASGLFAMDKDGYPKPIWNKLTGEIDYPLPNTGKKILI